MRIVIDARMLSWTGIGRYTDNLLRNLTQLDSKNEYHVLLLASDFDAWVPPAPNFKKVLSDYKPYGIGEQLLLPFQLYALRADLVHFPHFTAPILYFGRYIVTLHDLILVHYKNVRGQGLARVMYELKYRLMRLVLRHSLFISRHVITDTEFVKQDAVQSYSPNLPTSKITAIHLAVDPKLTKPSVTSEEKQPFLLYVGNTYPHKNLPALLAALKLVLASRPGLRLVLSGQDDYFYNRLKQQTKELGISKSVDFPGRVPDVELAWLYKHASLFVFPSLSEGFGLPPLEAMAYGTPVISSNASCMPEVLGDAAAYFDPTNPNDMAAKINTLLSDKTELARLRKAGPEHVKQFSWEKMAKETLEVYKKALKPS